MNKNIIICAGGSGGHIFPALSVYIDLKDKYNTLFLTDVRGEYFIKKFDKNIDFVSLPTIKATIKYIPSIFKTVLKSIKTFLTHKPDIIICFGGISTIIPTMIAKIFKVKIFIHEQNAIMGKANVFISKFIRPNKVMLSFKNTNHPIKNLDLILTRYPLFRKKSNRYVNKSFNNDLITILITGGSQGAEIFDKIIPNLLIQVITLFSDKNFKIIQQTKKENINNISELYNKCNIPNKVSDFFTNLDKLMQESDLMISRSGAGTIFEILEYKIPSIVIPIKNSAYDHQKLNAEYFCDVIDSIDEDNIYLLKEKLILLFKRPDILAEKYNKLINMQQQNCLYSISKLIDEELKNVRD